MAILNYTTEITVAKSSTEIQEILVKHKAQAIMTEYENGIISCFTFRIMTPQGMIYYKLPINIDGVYQVLQSNKKLSAKQKGRDQAARVAFRILKDWIAAQMAIIEAGMATLPQVFLPYAQTNNGKTVYERFEAKELPMLEG